MKINAKNILRKNKNIVKVEDFPITKNVANLTAQSEKNIIKLSEEENKLTISSCASVFFDNTTGTYKSISTSLQSETDTFTNSENSFETTIDQRTGLSKGLLLNDGTNTIKIVPEKVTSDIQGVLSATDKNKVIFKNFINDDTLEYSLKDDGVNISIIIPTLKNTYNYSFNIKTEGLYISLSNDNKKVVFVDKESKDKIFTINNIYMFDSKDECSTGVTLNLIENTDKSHTLNMVLNENWINDISREFPITVSPQVEIQNQPIVTLQSKRNNYSYPTDKSKVLLGIVNGKNYSVSAVVRTEQIIHELIANNMNKYNVGLELHYENGVRIEDSKGISVYSGSTLLSNNNLTSTEKNIFVDITELVQQEMQKYRTGREISNINLAFIYSCNSVASSDSDGYITISNIKNDYVIVKDRMNCDTELRPELHLTGEKNGEVLNGTPFTKYESNKAGETSINLYNSELSHSLNLGTIADNTLNIGVNMIYDTRYLKEATEKQYNNYFGKGWLTNVSQRLIKSNQYSKLLGSKSITYYDGENNAHILEEKWYYEVNDVRHYIPKDKVYIGADQELKYRDSEGKIHKVEYEATNTDGLTLVSTNSRMNYVKSSDMKVHKRYFMRLFDGTKYELYMDDDCNLSIPHCFIKSTPISIESCPTWIKNIASDFIEILKKTYVSFNFKNNEFHDVNDGLLSYDMVKSQLLYKNGKYYVRGLKSKYSIKTDDGTYEYYSIYDDFKDIEIEVEHEYYVNRSIPVADYYVSEDISSINSQISQVEDYIESLKQQTETISNSVLRLDKEINHQKLMRGKNLDINKVRDEATEKYNTAYDTTIYKIEENKQVVDTTATNANNKYRELTAEQTKLSDQYQSESYRYQIKSLESQLKEQQKSLKEIYLKLAEYETQLSNLEEQKESLVKNQKDTVQDYIIDTKGNILGFDYSGKLIYISDLYENEIGIYYDDNKLVEISSSKQKMSFNYNDSNILDYIIDTQGRRLKFEHSEDLLTKISFVGENNDKQFIKFDYSENYLSEIRDITDLKTIIYWEEGKIEAIKQITSTESITTDLKKVGEEKLIKFDSFRFMANDTEVVNELNKDATTYGFDGVGRLVYVVGEDNVFLEKSYSKLHFDEKKMLFNVNYQNKDLLGNLILGTGVGTSKNAVIDILEKEVTNSHILVKDIPTNGLVFAEIELLSGLEEMLKFNEIKLTATVVDSSGEKRKYSQVFNDLMCKVIGIPFVLKKTDKQIIFQLNTTKSINYSLVSELKVYDSDGSIYTYDENENLICEVNGLSSTEYHDFVNDKPTLIRTIDKFNIARDSYRFYNSSGKIVFEEDYLKNCKEYFYDEKERLIEEREYNKNSPTLARISKYTYDEFGNVVECDGVMRNEKGEYPQSKFRYLPNTSKLISKTTASGQVMCYGYDFNTDDLLEISSDTNGQVNKNKMTYKFGLLNSLEHHGVTVNYILDYKGRKKEINIANKTIITNEYFDDYTDENVKFGSKVITNNINGLKTEIIKNKKDKVVSISNNEGDMIVFNYDDKDRLIETNNKLDNEILTTNYDDNGLIVNSKSVYLNDTCVYEDYNYNDKDLLISIDRCLGDVNSKTTYFYDDKFDNRLYKTVINNDLSQEVEYDALGRVTKKLLSDNDKLLIEDEYEYLQYGENTIDLIKNHDVKIGEKLSNSTSYDYDVSGNITSIISDEYKTKYTYDSLNRLVREDNPILNQTIIYKYDNGGNILLKKIYKYTLSEELVGGEVIRYTYKTNGWKDQLVNYNGMTIEYDEMGRPYNYGDTSIKWNLKGQVIGFGNNSYTYNMNGIRTSKIVDGLETKFYLSGNKILREKSSENDIIYSYSMEKLIGFMYNNVGYIFERNIQGDILKIYRQNDLELVAEYQYDGYGNHKVINYTDEKIGDINPFRYRGYYFDRETGLYYLNSRYYSPELCRFISPDSIEYLDPESINGLNLYCYCMNNPIVYADPSGHSVILAMLIGAGIGLVVGLGSQLVSDVISNVITNGLDFSEWKMSSWQTYVGAGLGGAIGGALTPFLGPVVTGFITGVSSTAITMGLSNVTGASNYSFDEIFATSLLIGSVSGITAGILDNIKIPGVNSGRGSLTAVSKQINTKLVNGSIKNVSIKTIGKMAALNAIYSAPFTVFNGLFTNGIVLSPAY